MTHLYHGGQEGRAHFFSIAKNIHDRPADADTVRHWLEEDLDVDDLSRGRPRSPGSGGGASSPVRVSRVEGAAARVFCEVLKSKSLPPRPTLARLHAGHRHLDATGASLGDDFGEALILALPQLPGLEKLSLGENSLTDRTIEPLLRGLIAIGQLTSLDLSRNDIDAGGAAALREFVSNGDCPLEELVLRHADIDDDDCRALCESLASNRESRLRTLDVGDNLVGLNEGRNLCVPDYVTGGEALASALGVNVSLTKLDRRVRARARPRLRGQRVALRRQPRVQRLRGRGLRGRGHGPRAEQRHAHPAPRRSAREKTFRRGLFFGSLHAGTRLILSRDRPTTMIALIMRENVYESGPASMRSSRD